MSSSVKRQDVFQLLQFVEADRRLGDLRRAGIVAGQVLGFTMILHVGVSLGFYGRVEFVANEEGYAFAPQSCAHLLKVHEVRATRDLDVAPLGRTAEPIEQPARVG